MSAGTTPREATRRGPEADQLGRWSVFSVVVLGAFMAQLDLFIVNVAFPSISADFGGASNSTLSWVLNGYAIVFAACLVPAGRLADLIGRRRTFEVGIATFAMGSAICAASPSVAVLIGARVIQAVGAAMVIPTSLGLLLAAFPPAERAGATGAWAAGASVAATAGPPIGGLLILLDWRWIFLVNLPIAAVALIGSRRLIPADRPVETDETIDLAGVALLMAGISALVLAIVEGQTWGWSSPAFIAVIAVSIVLLGLFIWRSDNHPSPIVELDLLKLRPFAAANATMFGFMAAFGAVLLGCVLFLTGIWHEEAVIAGLMIAPGPAIGAILSPNTKHLVVRFGARPVAIVGSLFLAGSGAWLSLRLHSEPAFVTEFLPGTMMVGAGVGLVQPTLFATLPGVLPPERFATGSGVLNMSRQIALAVGVAILVAVLGSAPDLAAFQVGFKVVAGIALLAAAISTLLPARTKVGSAHPGESATRRASPRSATEEGTRRRPPVKSR
jgi:EmrB/QacA subfamily drug resistance transporter